MTPPRPLEIDLPEPVFAVSQRKYNIDTGSHWWQRLFFRCIYLPFNRFAFNWMHIPAMGEVSVTEKKTVFSWYEAQGIFTSKEQAKAACHGEFFDIRQFPLNGVLPDESVHGGHDYPKAGSPDRYAKPSFELVATPRKQIEREGAKLKAQLAKLHQVLDA